MSRNPPEVVAWGALHRAATAPRLDTASLARGRRERRSLASSSAAEHQFRAVCCGGLIREPPSVTHGWEVFAC